MFETSAFLNVSCWNSQLFPSMVRCIHLSGNKVLTTRKSFHWKRLLIKRPQELNVRKVERVIILCPERKASTYVCGIMDWYLGNQVALIEPLRNHDLSLRQTKQISNIPLTTKWYPVNKLNPEEA